MNRKVTTGARPRRGAAAQKRATAEAAAPAPLFAPVEREPAYTRVSTAIEHKILARTLRNGDVLPAETDLAQQFRVHRSTVREALRALEAEGWAAVRARCWSRWRTAVAAAATDPGGPPTRS